ENTFTFHDKRFSEEEGIKLGLGPTISYDAFKGEKNRLNLSLTIMVNFFDQLKVTQASNLETESRTYRAFSLAPRVHLQYHRKEIFPEIDFVLGTSMEVATPATFRAQEGAGQ